MKAKSAAGIGKRIRRARLARKMTQESLSEMCGVNASYIGQIERGEKQPSLRILSAIAGSLRVNPSSLLNADGDAHDAAVWKLVGVVSGYPAEVIETVTQHARIVVETFCNLEPPANGQADTDSVGEPGGGPRRADSHSHTTDS